MTLLKISNLAFKLLSALGRITRIVGSSTNFICLCLFLVFELESLETGPQFLTFTITVGKLLLKSKLLFL